MPVEIVFKAVDATNINDSRRNLMCYKRGDPVAATDKGIAWGSEVVIPPNQGGKFFIVEITDVTYTQLVTILRNRWPALNENNPIITPEYDIDGITPIRRCRLQIVWTSLPTSIRNALNRDGRYSTTLAVIRQYIRNKVTGEIL